MLRHLHRNERIHASPLNIERECIMRFHLAGQPSRKRWLICRLFATCRLTDAIWRQRSCYDRYFSSPDLDPKCFHFNKLFWTLNYWVIDYKETGCMWFVYKLLALSEQRYCETCIKTSRETGKNISGLFWRSVFPNCLKVWSCRV